MTKVTIVLNYDEKVLGKKWLTKNKMLEMMTTNDEVPAVTLKIDSVKEGGSVNG